MRSEQSPISCRFDAASTANCVMKDIDLSRQMATVTGGYSGLGLIMTRSLAEAGAKVVVPARNLEQARAALKGLRGVRIGIWI